MNNLPAYLTFIVAVIVAWIGLQQFFLAREKFKLDLFEKRFAIYKATQKFLVNLGNPTLGFDVLIEFSRETQDALFLFEKEIVDYLDELHKKAGSLINTNLKCKQLPMGTERFDLYEQETQLRLELGNELIKLKDVF